MKIGQAAYLTEQNQGPIYGTSEKSCYLYVSPDFYNTNIEIIQDTIQKHEKSFSRQDYRDFDEKYREHLGQKQYDLESARVYDSASKQIELKKQKYNNVSQKLINEYGIKYQEILEKDVSAEEKTNLKTKLLDETRSYDEKNRQAVLRLNQELDKLNRKFPR